MLSTAIPPYVKSLIAAIIKIYNERKNQHGKANVNVLLLQLKELKGYLKCKIEYI